jgi:hypothetical protein
MKCPPGWSTDTANFASYYYKYPVMVFGKDSFNYLVNNYSLGKRYANNWSNLFNDCVCNNAEEIHLYFSISRSAGKPDCYSCFFVVETIKLAINIYLDLLSFNLLR